MHGQSLQPILMGWVEMMCGADTALSAFHHFKHLQHKKMRALGIQNKSKKDIYLDLVSGCTRLQFINVFVQATTN